MSTTSPRSALSSAASAEGSPSPASASRIDERIAERIAAVLPEDRWTKRKMAEFLRTLGATQTSDLARAFWRSQRRGEEKSWFAQCTPRTPRGWAKLVKLSLPRKQEPALPLGCELPLAQGEWRPELAPLLGALGVLA